MELRLHAPERDGVSHGYFDKFSQRFTMPEYRFEISAQLGLNSNLGDDGGFHESSVLLLRYRRNERESCWRFVHKWP